MTLTAFAKSVLLLAALALPSFAQADPACMANIKLALTISHIGPGTFERDASGGYVLDAQKKRKPANSYSYLTKDGLTYLEEQATKPLVTKYGMKELLEDLLEEGVFPNGETSVKGWSLKLVNTTDREHFHTYLYKAGQPSVKVTNVLSLNLVTRFFTGKISTKMTLSAPKGSVKTAKSTGTVTLKGTVNLRLGAESVGFMAVLQGMGTGTGKPHLLPDYSRNVMLTTLKSTSLYGALEAGPGAPPTFAEGSVSTSSPTFIEDVEVTFPGFFSAGL